MFYLLSKTLDLLFSPLTWVIVLLVTTIALGEKRARRARQVALGALGILVLFSLQIVSNGLWRALETPDTRTVREDVTYDAVILLGGLVDDRITEDFGAPAYESSVERLLATYDLLRRDRARFAVISAGPIVAHHSSAIEAQVLADQLVTWGIDRDRLVVEASSHNTRDNAVESARIVRERGWTRLLLVTSAFHMKRANGCFRAVGLPVDALPVDYRSYDPARHPVSWLPRSGYLDESVQALREVAGRATYRARGFSE